jgi:hypothetical protein
MGKRSRLVQTRRTRQDQLEKATHSRAVTNLRAGAFCCIAAMLSERFGTASAIAWMSDSCFMPEKDASQAIAIGRRLIAQGRRNLDLVTTA